MDNVYILWHMHELADGNDDSKLIGVYRTEDNANAAIKRVRDQPGFNELPNGFLIDRYELDKDHWTEGFVTV